MKEQLDFSAFMAPEIVKVTSTYAYSTLWGSVTFQVYRRGQCIPRVLNR